MPHVIQSLGVCQKDNLWNTILHTYKCFLWLSAIYTLSFNQKNTGTLYSRGFYLFYKTYNGMHNVILPPCLNRHRFLFLDPLIRSWWLGFMMSILDPILYQFILISSFLLDICLVTEVSDLLKPYHLCN